MSRRFQKSNPPFNSTPVHQHHAGCIHSTFQSRLLAMCHPQRVIPGLIAMGQVIFSVLCIHIGFAISAAHATSLRLDWFCDPAHPTRAAPTVDCEHYHFLYASEQSWWIRLTIITILFGFLVFIVPPKRDDNAVLL
jgi:hypothetical protein